MDLIRLSRLSLALLACLNATNALAQSKPKPRRPVDEMAAKLEPTRVVAYKQVGDRELHLHIFEPQGFQASDRRACFVVIHGGGWTGGAPRRMYPFAAHYAERGLVGISVEYRLLNPKAGTTVFDCVADGRSAVRYVREHAKELGIDPDKIIVSGGSAGGHVAVGTALFTGVDDEQDNRAISSMPNALVLLFPVIDTSTAGYGNAKIGQRWRELSPVHHVSKNLPPTIVFHGTGDTVTPFAGAKAFHEAMLAAGNRCELVVNEGGRHGYLMFDRQLYLDTLAKADAFLASLGMLGETTK
jgi:acetyl esterase/lipase